MRFANGTVQTLFNLFVVFLCVMNLIHFRSVLSFDVIVFIQRGIGRQKKYTVIGQKTFDTKLNSISKY